MFSCILDANLQKLTRNACHFQIYCLQFIYCEITRWFKAVVSVFHDSKMWPRQLHCSSIKSAVVNPRTTTYTNHTNNPGKAHWTNEFSTDALNELLLIICKCRWSVVILYRKNMINRLEQFDPEVESADWVDQFGSVCI